MTKKEIKQAWEKFLNSKGKDVGIVIRCDTEKKANKLLKFLDKKGFKWSSGKRLNEENYWSAYQKEIYYNSVVTCESKDFSKIILEFDDIEKYLKKKKKVTLKKYSKTYKEFNENICKKTDCSTCKLSYRNNEKNVVCKELLIKYTCTAYKKMKKMLKEYKENED